MPSILSVKTPLMSGTEVKDAQNIINGLGYGSVIVDGYYGQATADKVKLFQGGNGLKVDGIVGPETWSKMFLMVKDIQTKLNALGYNCGAVDGYYGTNVKTQVTNFQRAKGLSQTGIADKATRDKMVTIPPSIYNMKATHPVFGTFYYRDLTNGLIERDPKWDEANLIYVSVPTALQKKCTASGVTRLRVNKAVQSKWETAIAKLTDNLQYIDNFDAGTSYGKHQMSNIKNPISNHAWGIAIDINTATPMKKITDTSHKNYKLWENVFKPTGFEWGNNFSNNPDPMHYELNKK